MTAALVVNADDLGVSKEATLGVVKAHRGDRHQREPRSDDSVLSACGGFVRAYVSRPGDRSSLHVDFGKPVSDAERVPLLIGEDGFFRWRFMSLLRAVSVQKKPELLGQVEIELDAQPWRRGAEAAKHFTWEAAVQNHLKVYRAAVTS